MRPTVLVATTVHHPDDTRIRERLIRTLSTIFEVTYAASAPGPTDRSGLEWVPLAGGRIRRNLGVLRLLLRGRWDVAVVHDPELIPGAIVAKVLRSRPVVFDVHEDLAAQIEAKQWIPRPLRPAARVVARLLYRLAETGLVLTMAEPGYQRLFRGDQVVFPNHPHYEGWPEPVDDTDGGAVYVGDVRVERGVEDAVAACARLGVPLTLIGPVEPHLERRLKGQAGEHDMHLEVVGRLPNTEAMRRVARSAVGLAPLHPMPNYIHSLPTKTLEYLAMGVPVVASDLPGTRAIIGGLEAVWLVTPGDVDALAEGIGQAIAPEARRAAFSQAKRIRERFCWPASEVAGFYESLVNA